MDNQNRILVHLHLYYTDLWEWFIPYLQKINVSHDLYVTLTKGMSDDSFETKIQSTFPDAKIRYYDNKGMDVAPFLGILNEVISAGKNYKGILKLHGKKSLAHNATLGETWRTALVTALLNSTSEFNKHLDCVENTNFKMVASKNWVLSETVRGYEGKFFKDFTFNGRYEFVGGTMFLANFNMFKEWFIDNDIFEKFNPQFEFGYKPDHTLAHQLERVFGCLVCISGNQILKI